MLRTRLAWVFVVAVLGGTWLRAQWAGMPADAKGKQERVDKLMGVLRSEAGLNEKHGACRELAVIGGKEAVGALAELLSDEKMSHMARYALEPIPEAAVDDALRQAAGKVKGRLLVGVINSIGVRRDAKAIDVLAKLLGDADVEVASAAATSLGKIGDAAAGKALEQALDNAPAGVRAAVCDACVRCADALAAAGKRPEATALYDRVRGAEAPRPIRMAAMRGAIVVRQSAGLNLLMEQLRSEDAGMFAVALRLAHELSGAELTAALSAEVGKLGPDKQVLLIETLGDRGDAVALPAVLAAAKSGEAKVRLTAIRVLPQLAGASVVPFLFEVASGADGELARAAQLSLAALPGKETDAAIVAMLDQKDAKTRRITIELLGQRRVATAMPLLLKAVEEADGEMRIVAIKALGDMAGVAELSALIVAMTKAGSNEEMQSAEGALAGACARIGDGEACAEKLVGALAQAQVGPKRALLRILRSVGGEKALEAVRKAAKDGNAEIGDTAIRALCDWTSADASGDMLEIAKTSANATYKTLGLRGYIRLIGDKAIADDKKLAMCKEAMALAQRNEEKRLVLGALGGMGSAEALALAIAHLENAGTKDEACAAAVAIGQRLVQSNPAAVAEAMKKVLEQVTPNTEAARRAKALLDRAGSRSGGK
jgi:HEAT repeat protein